MGSIVKTIAFLMLCASAFGQMGHKHLLIAPRLTSTTPDVLPHGIQFRWISTNLNNPVTNWTDIVSSYSITNSANFPNWTNNQGVHFDGSQFLNFTNITINSGHAYLLVVKPSSVSGFQGIIGHTINGTDFGISSSQWWDQAGPFGKAVANNTYDIFYAANQAGQPLAQNNPYTNAVLVTGQVGGGWSGSTLDFMGKGSGSFYVGTVFEFIIWSNAQTFTASELNLIHKYCTNTYSFTP